jgi:hypothetical protein
VQVNDEDVVYFDASKDPYILLVDGSNLGLSSTTVDAIAFWAQRLLPRRIRFAATSGAGAAPLTVSLES